VSRNPRGVPAIALAYTISDLERETGLGRSTIHYYLRRGLLPLPQKTAPNQALYGRHHLELLKRIRELKEAGRSLAEIRSELSVEIGRDQENVDLAAHEYDRVHQKILRAATQEFLAKGYEGTRVARIIRKAEVNSTIFYAHFPSKLRLLAESFRTFLAWNHAWTTEKTADTPDSVERVLWGLAANKNARAFDSMVMSRVQSPEGDPENLRIAQQAWAPIAAWLQGELDEARGKKPSIPRVSTELLAWSIIGAYHNALMRGSWDDAYTPADLAETQLWLWMAVLAALAGDVDIDLRMKPYLGLIKQVAMSQPETPQPVDQLPQPRATDISSRSPQT
jgi:AcrR family transcriptional regulator